MTQEQENKLDEIYAALVSDKKLGRVGLVERVETLEANAKVDRDLKLKVTGGMIVLSFVGSVAVSLVIWVINKFWS